MYGIKYIDPVPLALFLGLGHLKVARLLTGQHLRVVWHLDVASTVSIGSSFQTDVALIYDSFPLSNIFSRTYTGRQYSVSPQTLDFDVMDLGAPSLSVVNSTGYSFGTAADANVGDVLECDVAFELPLGILYGTVVNISLPIYFSAVAGQPRILAAGWISNGTVASPRVATNISFLQARPATVAYSAHQHAILLGNIRSSGRGRGKGKGGAYVSTTRVVHIRFSVVVLDAAPNYNGNQHTIGAVVASAGGDNFNTKASFRVREPLLTGQLQATPNTGDAGDFMDVAQIVYHAVPSYGPAYGASYAVQLPANVDFVGGNHSVALITNTSRNPVVLACFLALAMQQPCAPAPKDSGVTLPNVPNFTFDDYSINALDNAVLSSGGATAQFSAANASVAIPFMPVNAVLVIMHRVYIKQSVRPAEPLAIGSAVTWLSRPPELLLQGKVPHRTYPASPYSDGIASAFETIIQADGFSSTSVKLTEFTGSGNKMGAPNALGAGESVTVVFTTRLPEGTFGALDLAFDFGEDRGSMPFMVIYSVEIELGSSLAFPTNITVGGLDTAKATVSLGAGVNQYNNNATDADLLVARVKLYPDNKNPLLVTGSTHLLTATATSGTATTKLQQPFIIAGPVLEGEIGVQANYYATQWQPAGSDQLEFDLSVLHGTSSLDDAYDLVVDLKVYGTAAHRVLSMSGITSSSTSTSSTTSESSSTTSSGSSSTSTSTTSANKTSGVEEFGPRMANKTTTTTTATTRTTSTMTTTTTTSTTTTPLPSFTLSQISRAFLLRDSTMALNVLVALQPDTAAGDTVCVDMNVTYRAPPTGLNKAGMLFLPTITTCFSWTSTTTTTVTTTTLTTTTVTTTTIPAVTLVFDQFDFSTTNLTVLETSLRLVLAKLEVSEAATMPTEFIEGSIVATLGPSLRADYDIIVANKDLIINAIYLAMLGSTEGDAGGGGDSGMSSSAIAGVVSSIAIIFLLAVAMLLLVVKKRDAGSTGDGVPIAKENHMSSSALKMKTLDGKDGANPTYGLAETNMDSPYDHAKKKKKKANNGDVYENNEAKEGDGIYGLAGKDGGDEGTYGLAAESKETRRKRRSTLPYDMGENGSASGSSDEDEEDEDKVYSNNTLKRNTKWSMSKTGFKGGKGDRDTVYGLGNDDNDQIYGLANDDSGDEDGDGDGDGVYSNNKKRTKRGNDKEGVYGLAGEGSGDNEGVYGLAGLAGKKEEVYENNQKTKQKKKKNKKTVREDPVYGLGADDNRDGADAAEDTVGLPYGVAESGDSSSSDDGSDASGGAVKEDTYDNPLANKAAAAVAAEATAKAQRPSQIDRLEQQQSVRSSDIVNVYGIGDLSEDDNDAFLELSRAVLGTAASGIQKNMRSSVKQYGSGSDVNTRMFSVKKNVSKSAGDDGTVDDFAATLQALSPGGGSAQSSPESQGSPSTGSFLKTQRSGSIISFSEPVENLVGRVMSDVDGNSDDEAAMLQDTIHALERDHAVETLPDGYLENGEDVADDYIDNGDDGNDDYINNGDSDDNGGGSVGPSMHGFGDARLGGGGGSVGPSMHGFGDAPLGGGGEPRINETETSVIDSVMPEVEADDDQHVALEGYLDMNATLTAPAPGKSSKSKSATFKSAKANAKSKSSTMPSMARPSEGYTKVGTGPHKAKSTKHHHAARDTSGVLSPPLPPRMSVVRRKSLGAISIGPDGLPASTTVTSTSTVSTDDGQGQTSVVTEL